MDHFTYQNQQLFAEEVSLESLAETVGTPFYCYSTATFTRHFNVFNEALKEYDRKICFAVKSNPNIAVLKTLADEGAGADVVSEGEIRLAQAAGIAADKIVFSGVGKTREEMAYALKQGIFQFNAESAYELEMLNEVASSLNVKAPVALRVNPDVDPKTHAKISTGMSENKFGIAFDQVRQAYNHAASLPHLRVQGVSMHIGSQLTDLTPFRQAFRAIVSMVEQLRADGHAIQTLDLGGGLGIPYGDAPQDPPNPVDYAEAVKAEIPHFDGTLLFEPGRMIAGNAGVLVTRIIAEKKTANKQFLIVDAGMNDLMRPALYDAYHEIVSVKKASVASKNISTEKEVSGVLKRGQQTVPVCRASARPNISPAIMPGSVGEADSPCENQQIFTGQIKRYDIVGPVCESSDVFGKDRVLDSPKVGDLLAFRSCGAYGASMSNRYNARRIVPEVLVKGDQWAVTRPRDDYQAIIGAYRIPDWLMEEEESYDD